MICPKCGEVNASNFLFCGMCGTILEPARRATVPTPTPPAPARLVAEARPANVPEPPVATVISAPPSIAATVAVRTVSDAAAMGGPSMAGLNPSNVDVLRERAFSGMDLYAEREDAKSSAGRVVLLLVLLVALGMAGWWAYNNYLGIVDGHKGGGPTQPEVATGSSTPPEVSSSPASSIPVRGTEANPAPPPERATPESDRDPSPAAGASAEPQSEAKSSPTLEIPRAVAPAPTPARHEVSAARVPAPKAAPPAMNEGEALFRKGQGFLYGRGGTEDCPDAIKYLKMASDKSHAKARSMMGTMYATGHCVPRDLPSSYRWFALALRADPNNGILEKDLSAVWNQMTPPERQMATKSQ